MIDVGDHRIAERLLHDRVQIFVRPARFRPSGTRLDKPVSRRWLVRIHPDPPLATGGERLVSGQGPRVRLSYSLNLTKWPDEELPGAGDAGHEQS